MAVAEVLYDDEQAVALARRLSDILARRRQPAPEASALGECRRGEPSQGPPPDAAPDAP